MSGPSTAGPEREARSSRRRFLARTAGVVGGGALAALAPAGLLRPAGAVAVQPPIHPRGDWGPDLPPRGPLPSELPGDVRFLLVHHTAGANGYPPEAVPSILRSTYQFHVGPRGWNDIAYNFLVDAHGGIWEGRQGSLAGPVKGDASGGSQGFAQLCCFLGDHQTTPPPATAVAAMAHLLAWLAGRYGIDLQAGATASFVSRGSSLHPAGRLVTTSTIAAHREMSATTCPGDAGYRVVKGQLSQMAAALAAGHPPRQEVFAFGRAPDLGSTAGGPLAFPLVGMAATPTGGGYWLVASDGGIFAYGDAPFSGSTGGLRLDRPVVGMAPTPTGRGYWLVASDGGIFAHGDAPFLGSTGGLRLDRPVVGMAPTPTGGGYWLVASDGGIFAFGDAPFSGSTGGVRLVSPIVGIAASPTGNGYRLVAGDGGVFAFGDASFSGRPDPAALRSGRAVAITSLPAGGGYWVAATR